MVTRIGVLGLSCLWLLLAGCGSDPIDRAIEGNRRTADLVCGGCPIIVGAATEAECRARLDEGTITEREEDCVRRVYSAHEDELKPVLDCQFEAGQDLRDCLRPLVDTCPPSAAAVSACGAMFNTAMEDCPTPSTQTQAELQACFASRD